MEAFVMLRTDGTVDHSEYTTVQLKNEQANNI